MKTTRMHKLSDITLSMWFVSIIMIMQGTEAEGCSTKQIESCASAYSSALAESAAVGDRETICSIVNIYLECLNTYFSECNLDAGQAIDSAKKSLSQYGCEYLTSSLSAEEVEAQSCSAPKMQSCVSALGSLITQAAEDKEKICSAGNIYLECVSKVVTDCSLDVGQTLIKAKQALSQYGCVSDSGAGSRVINLVTYGLGLACYKLLMYLIV